MTNMFEIPLFFKEYCKYSWPEFINFHIVNSLSPESEYFWDSFPFPNLIKNTVPCHLPFESIYFTYDGKVTLCCRDYDGDLIVGDIRNNSIPEIWNGKKSEAIRKQNINPELLEIDACKRCYQPYSFISELINYYIHYLYYSYLNLPPQNFGELIISFLKKLDSLTNIKDKEILKKTVFNLFNKNRKLQK
jgi:radical SAM protein with 4Fe4S-binding SPASM domain